MTPVYNAFGPFRGGSIILQCAPCSITVSRPQDFCSDRSLKSTGLEITTINGITLGCRCGVNLDHLSMLKLAHLSSLWLHFILIRSIFDETRNRTKMTGLLLRRTQRLRGQYCRIGFLKLYFDKTDEDVLLLHLERQNCLDANCCLESEPDKPCTIEIV
jgi:hypothetical protein